MDRELQEFLEEYYNPSGKPQEEASPQIVTKSINHAVSFQIVDARHLKHMTQRQLAKLSGTSQPIISRLESGRSNPRLRTLGRICAVLELRISLK